MKKKSDRPICSQDENGSRKLFSAATERKRVPDSLAVAVPVLLRKRPRWVDRDM
jgi:hypothetical protein